MQVTVLDVLSLPIMKRCRLMAGGRGLSRAVEYVDVLESPQGLGWLKPNDILITSIFPILHDEQAQQRLISDLYAMDVSLLLIKTGRFVPSIPEFMVDQANQYDLPLVELPADIVYAELISNISALIINQKAIAVQKYVDVASMFITIMEHGGRISDIADALAKISQCPVIIEDENYRILACCLNPSSCNLDENNLLLTNRMVKRKAYRDFLKTHPDADIFRSPPYVDGNSYGLTVVPMRYQGKLWGNVTLIQTSSDSEGRELALRNAASFATICLREQHAALEKETLIRNGMFLDLLHNKNHSAQDIQHWLDYFHFDPNAQYRLFLIHIIPTKKDFPFHTQGDFHMLMGHLSSFLDHACWIHEQENIIVVIPQMSKSIRDYQSTRNYLTAIHERLSELNCCAFYLADGGICESIYEVRTIYEHAKVALEFGIKMYQQNSICWYDELDTFYLFSCFKEQKELRDFCHNLLSPLLQSHFQFDAIETLNTYLHTGGSLEKTAQLLFTHKNTVKYRLGKIRAALGNDLSEAQYLFKLQIALIVHRLQNM